MAGTVCEPCRVEAVGLDLQQRRHPVQGAGRVGAGALAGGGRAVGDPGKRRHHHGSAGHDQALTVGVGLACGVRECPKCGERRGVPLPELAEAAPSVVGLGRGGQGPGGGLQCRRGGADLLVGVRRERRGPGPDLAGERGPGEVGDVPVGGKVRAGRLADPVEQAGDRVVVPLARAAERRTTVGEPAFDVLEAAGAEKLGEHLVPVVRAGAQERVELALGEQHHLAELTQGHAQEVGDQVARLVEPVGEAAPADPVGVDDGLLDQHVGLLGGEPDATLLGALPLR